MTAFPELRFAEFDESWKSNKLSEVTQTITDGTHFSPETFDVGDYKYITSKNIRMGRMKLDDISYISTKDHEHIYSTCQVELGDVLLTKDGASTGNICLNELDEEFSLLSSVALIKADKAKTFNEYLYHYFVSSYGSREVKKSVAGQAITRITLTNLSNFKFRFPSLKEQKKIADFLGAVDEKIAGLRERESLLTQYKKGVIQKIFSQEIRFKRDDGSDFPDWQKSKLGDITEFYKGKGISKADIVDEGDFECIRYGEIYTRYSEIISEVHSKTNTPQDKQFLSQDNDVIIPASGEDRLDMARACHVTIAEVALGGDINVLRGDTNGSFLAYYLNNAKKKEIARYAQGNSVVHLYGTQLKLLEVSIPHPDEQQKIADFLSAIDDKITAVSAQITQMQDFKKGLLQQMFV